MKQSIKLRKTTIITLFFPLFLGSCSLFKKTIKQEEERRIIDYFIADKNGNRITQIDPSKEKYFYLVILSENAIGEEATLAIEEEEDEEVGYIHKGVYLGEKIRFKIRRNKEKLKLYIYDPKNKRHRRLKEKAMKSWEKE